VTWHSVQVGRLEPRDEKKRFRVSAPTERLEVKIRD
jgi:hypothetical protein